MTDSASPARRPHFVLPMLWRETRASWPRLMLLVLCIAAGVGGLVAVKSFSHTLHSAIQGEARTLMAADLVVRGNRPFSDSDLQAVSGLRGQGAQVASSVEFLSMARARSGKVLLVDARAVSAGYPLYGEVLLQDRRPLASVLGDDTVVVHGALLINLGLKVGDELRLGQRSFRIADVLIKEPDSPVVLANVGPRVLMTEAGGRATGLIAPTSRIRYTLMVKLAAGADPHAVADELKQRLAGSYATVSTYDRAQPTVTRFLGQLTDFLNLVGLVALLLGGIGVAGAIRVFMAQKMESLAVLKCLGATGRQLFLVYGLQAAALGLLGSLAGVALGVATQWVLARLLADLLPVTLGLALSPAALAQGLLLGTLVTLAFSLPPLLEAWRVPPGRVFRRLVEAPARALASRWRTALTYAAWGAGGLALIYGLAWWQARSPLVALIFSLGLMGTVAALLAAAHLLLWGLRRAPKPPFFIFRQGLSGLYRPGNQTVPAVVALGLGIFLLLAVMLIQQDLLHQIGAPQAGDQPNLFFMDIQPEQRAPFEQVLQARGLPAAELVPVVRGRLYALNNERVNVEALPEGQRKRILGYEFAFTYRGKLIRGERVIEGRFAPDPAVAGPQVSAEDWWMKEVGMKLGDTVTLDIQGIRLKAAITSVREVEWTNRRANFSFVFLPGALEKAPQIFVAALQVPDAEARARLQQAVVARLPNVTGLDVDIVFHLVQQLLDRIALGVQFMAAFSVAVGLVILLGAIATTKYQHLREAVLLRTLGATRSTVARILVLEYALLGALAGLVGVAAAGALTWALVTYVFNGRWQPAPGPYGAAWAAALAVIALTGLLSSLDVLMKKPLDVLREE